MSAFFVSPHYQFHSVPGSSTRKHLRWCFLQQQLVRTVSYYEFPVFHISSLLSSSRFRWFQLVAGGLSPFQLISGGSSLFLFVPRFSMQFNITGSRACRFNHFVENKSQVTKVLEDRMKRVKLDKLIPNFLLRRYNENAVRIVLCIF